jgi:hypothetical protein
MLSKSLYVKGAFKPKSTETAPLARPQAIQRYTAGMNLVSFRKDRKTYDASSVEPISEAAAKLGDLAPALVPGQPWQEIRSLGNRLCAPPARTHAAVGGTAG